MPKTMVRIPEPTMLPIRDATEHDSDEIVRISRALQYAPGQQNDSFLMSDLTGHDYEDLARDADVIFLVAEDGGRIVGFIFAYNEKYAARQHAISDKAIFSLLGRRARFHVVKQIAIDPTRKRAGMGRELYRQLWSRLKGDFVEHSHDTSQSARAHVFTAIVTDPRNVASEQFHRKIGYAPILESSTQNKKTKDTYPNKIWYRSIHGNLLEEILPPETQQAQVQALEFLIKNLEHSTQLYLHEDNLNWKKITIMTTLLFVLIASAWVVVYSNISGRAPGAVKIELAMLSAIGVFGILASLMMIRSGVEFMAKHKQAARLVEARIKMIDPQFFPVVWNVATESLTIRIIRIVFPYIISLVWLTTMAWMFYVVSHR
jgi:predicted GNAT superfamily acetyltransferase